MDDDPGGGFTLTTLFQFLTSTQAHQSFLLMNALPTASRQLVRLRIR